MKGGYKPFIIYLKISNPKPKMNIVSNLPLSLLFLLVLGIVLYPKMCRSDNTANDLY